MANALVYCWGAQNERALVRGITELGYEVTVFDRKCKDYDFDGRFTMELLLLLNQKKWEYVISFNYFPIIASACKNAGVKYISWVYDMPHTTLYSKKIAEDGAYLFLFDQAQANQLQSKGCRRAWHMPLASDISEFEKTLSGQSESGKKKYEVSFVGSLYRDSHSYYEQLSNLPVNAQKRLDRIIELQSFQYGEHLVIDSLDEVLCDAMSEVIDLRIGPQYEVSRQDLIAALIDRRITAMERAESLNALADIAQVSLFSGSSAVLSSKIVQYPFADYNTQVPFIYHNSRINLNITLRSIENGIPLRALDIMACGGFLFSNFQPELADSFEDGKELVLFYDKEDLVNKVQYYLNHEEERVQIAYCGQKKIRECYTYSVLLLKILQTAEVIV